jgi:hypothetical protein
MTFWQLNTSLVDIKSFIVDKRFSIKFVELSDFSVQKGEFNKDNGIQRCQFKALLKRQC